MPLLTYKLKYGLKGLKHKTTYTTETSVIDGDVIEVDTGDFRYVAKVKQLGDSYQLVLSGPLDSNKRAYLESIQQRYEKISNP